MDKEYYRDELGQINFNEMGEDIEDNEEERYEYIKDIND